MKKLSDWAKENNISYKQAWTLYKNNALPVKAKESKSGRIYVAQASKDKSLPKEITFGTPLMTSYTKSGKRISTAGDTGGTTRRNRIATTSPSDEFHHILSGVEPYVLASGKGGRAGFWDTNFCINLCQKAYWNFAIFRNTIDAMTDFSVSPLYLRGGTAKSRDFFEKLFHAINIMDLEDKFFREYYRSGNVFLYRFDSIPVKDDLTLLSKTYGFQIDAAKKIKLPSRYIILNPCDIAVQANVAFANVAMFFKRLNGYEIHRLRNPQTDAEKNFLKSLPQITQDQINSGAGAIIIPLDPDIIYAVFYKKQDYEPLAIPMGWPVLKDIEWKAEMKHIDMAVSRTMQNVILLVKMGYEDKNGNYMFDQKAAAAMQQLFENESVGKTLVGDFTTQASFVIPAIGDFLDPKKYEIVNMDIKEGLNYVLTGTDTKFSSQYIMVQLFIERLQRAREAFITQFLLPEIRRISKALGFRSYPTPFFNDIDLKDTTSFDRIIAQLAQYGILTPAETFNALETGRLPTDEESVEAQTQLKPLKQKGYYQPIIGGPANQMDLTKETGNQQMALQKDQQEHDKTMQKQQHKHDAANPAPAPPPAIHISAPGLKQQAGRPGGSGSPQTTKKVSPLKASTEENELYSLSKIKDNMILMMELNANVELALCKKHKIKKLNDEQKSVASDITDLITVQEEPGNWKSSVAKYIENPIAQNSERTREIDKLAYEHGISPFLASILYISKKENA